MQLCNITLTLNKCKKKMHCSLSPRRKNR
ncbi:hypothetical protein AHF37_12179 [Paragonimus kellicotti]|nr:hypothetical protein AHF37_12179 [Paragonimus kellicotti]